MPPLKLRALGTLLGLAAMVGEVRVAQAGDPDAQKKACIAASTDGQKLRDDRKLAAARDKFIGCAAQTCPELVRMDCSEWLAEVEHLQPTIVPSAKDQNGNDLLDARLSIDGVAIPSPLDGRALTLDPGAHTLVFVSGAARAEMTLIVKEGEKSRLVVATLTLQTKKPPPETTTSEASPLPFVFLGASAVALASFTYFALKGRSQWSSLEGGCKPSCDPSDVEAMRKKFLVADVSLGVALVTAGLGAYLLVSRHTEEAPAAAPTVSFDLGVAHGGGFATIDARF